MRVIAVLAGLLIVAAVGHADQFVAVGRADEVRLQWPLRPGTPALTRAFDAPTRDWQSGHRGVDLAGSPGQPVYAAAAGIVVFAGVLADRPVVSVQHAGGLRTSYEPVQAAVRAGQQVDASSGLGRLVTGHAGCPVAACLHWGAMWGPAQRAQYVDPLGLLAAMPVRLKPLTG